jgi:hypothetical protein
VTLATVLTVLVLGHEDTGTTGVVGALTTETGDLARLIDLVELEDSHLDLGTLVLDLLGGSVGLLLSLLTTTEELGVEVEGGVVLDTVEREGLTILEGLTGERETLERSVNTCLNYLVSIHGKACFFIMNILPSRAAIMVLTFSTQVAEETSKARVLPARDLTKSCIANK